MKGCINDALVHFLRDAHELKEHHPHDKELLAWATAVKAIYEQAVAWAEHGPDPELSPRKPQQARTAQQHADRGSTSGRCANLTRIRRLLNIRSANGSNAFCLSSLSLWGFRVSQRTTTWPSAVFAHWSWLAKSAGALAVPKAARPAWDSPVSLLLGWPRNSIPFSNVSLLSP